MIDARVATSSPAGASLARTRASTTARLLAAGNVVAACSACAVVIAGVALIQATPAAILNPLRAWGLWYVLVAGLPAACYAWRVRLDAGLFADLAATLATPASPESALAQLDATLSSLGLSPANDLTPRSLHHRCQGATRLLVVQAAIAILQSLAMLALLVPVAR